MACSGVRSLELHTLQLLNHNQGMLCWYRLSEHCCHVNVRSSRSSWTSSVPKEALIAADPATTVHFGNLDLKFSQIEGEVWTRAPNEDFDTHMIDPSAATQR